MWIIFSDGVYWDMGSHFGWVSGLVGLVDDWVDSIKWQGSVFIMSYSFTYLIDGRTI